MRKMTEEISYEDFKEHAFTPHEVRGGVYRSGYARLKSKVYNTPHPKMCFVEGVLMQG